MAGRIAAAVLIACGALARPVFAQEGESCRVICELEWKVEPTFTIENLALRHRVLTPEGQSERVARERVFELVLALDFKTRRDWLGFTAEASAAPFSDDNAVELEFEAKFYWLTERRTRGWLSSHLDVVDQFSPGERPDNSRAYTHKLDFELDTAVKPFKRLREGRWLRDVELETSLDFLATGSPKAGDVFPDGSRYLDDASRWSLSLVIVLPVAPF